MLVAALGVSARLTPAAPFPSPADAQTLKAAGIAADGPSLLDYFRQQTLTTGAQERAQALVRSLGDDSFRLRENASTALVELGAAAVPLLRQALQDPDIEIVRRAEECLHRMKDRSASEVPAAAAREVARRKPPGAAAVLLAYLPFAPNAAVSQEVREALAAVTSRDGKPEAALVAALADPVAPRRAAAAEALCRAGVAGQRTAVRRLLRDPDPAVRLPVAMALTARGDKDAVPVLIDLLALAPRPEAYQVVDLLFRLAGDQAPEVGLGEDEDGRQRCRQAWASWWDGHRAEADLGRLACPPRLRGYTLAIIMDQLGESPGRVVEFGPDGKPRWEIKGLQFPLDAQVLGDDRVLVAENTANRVTERDTHGRVVWEKAVTAPIMAQRLPNGNTFIASNHQLLEVDRDGKEVFSHAVPNEMIMKAAKLRTGEIALVSFNHRFVRMDAGGKELQSFPAFIDLWGGRLDVLPNGHVLVPECNNNRVVEYNTDGEVAWEARVESPVAAVRLPDGHTLVTCMNKDRGVELDRNGREVWEYRAPIRVARLFRR
jgi:hypothetical protein